MPNPEYIWGYRLLVLPFDFDNPRFLEKALLGKELRQKLLLLTKSTTQNYSKLLLKNFEEILFGWIFLGTHTAQAVSKHVWVRRWPLTIFAKGSVVGV